MSRIRFLLVLAVLFGLIASASSQDQQKKQEENRLDAKKEKETRLTAKVEDVRLARYIDFSRELEMPIPALANLGEIIDKARLSADPIALAGAAKILQAAEAAAGKTAALKSGEVLDEAVKLAKVRNVHAELSLLAKLVGGDAAEDLEELAGQAKKKAPETREVSRDLDGTLIVHNHTHSDIHVYIDGHAKGHVHGHGTGSFHVHHAHQATARDHFGHYWHVHFNGHHHVWRWVITDPHQPH